MEDNMSSQPRYRSLFWPMILIGVGLVWFLSNINVIPNFNPLSLINLWPLLLIALGLDLLFWRKSAVVGLLIGLGTVGAAIVILLAAPNLAGSQQAATETFTEPLAGVTSAVIDISSSSEPLNIHSLSDSANLFEGMIIHNGIIDYQASGSSEKHISLSERGPNIQFFFGTTNYNLRWDIGLNPGVPIRLNVDSASGSVQMHLEGLQLSALNVDGASGSLTIDLPVSTGPYAVDYKGGSGSLNMTIPAGADVTITLDGASGSLNLNLPSNAALRVDVRDKGSGSVNMPGGMTRKSGSGETGVWETGNYAGAANKITIIATDLGSGSLNID
jgi:hypothetical protein